MSSIGPSDGALIMIKIVSYEMLKSIFWLKLTITKKVVKFYNG